MLLLSSLLEMNWFGVYEVMCKKGSVTVADMRHRQEFTRVNGRIVEDTSLLDSWLTTECRKCILLQRRKRWQ